MCVLKLKQNSQTCPIPNASLLQRENRSTSHRTIFCVLHKRSIARRTKDNRHSSFPLILRIHTQHASSRAYVHIHVPITLTFPRKTRRLLHLKRGARFYPDYGRAKRKIMCLSLTVRCVCMYVTMFVCYPLEQRSATGGP